ncbi:unnamed protein product [Prunus armeniaca]
MDWDPFSWVCRATQPVPQAKVLGADHMGPQVVEWVEVLANSGELELVPEPLAELDPHALGWEGLLPSAQLGFLYALVLELSVQ